MVRERANDPYASGQDRPGGVRRGFQDYLRYIVVGIAAVLILLGISLGMSAFTLVRGIIEGPETLAGHLDAWVGPGDASAAEGVAIPVSNVAPVAETSDGIDEPDAEPDPSGDAAEASARRGGPAAGPRNPARGVGRSAAAERGGTEIGFVDDFFQLLREGGMSRAVGALFILLFTLILVRMPFGFLRAGIGLLSDVAFPKSK